MTFRYKNWILYKSKIISENGSKRTIHFFSKYRPFKGEPCDLPKGAIVEIDKRTGLPLLRKDKFVRTMTASNHNPKASM
jgi:hypothetical protein